MDVSTTRTLYWEGSSRQELKTFPLPVQKDLGLALYVLQIGGKPQFMKHWKGLGSGVLELRETWMGDAFRVVVMLPGHEAIHVLHAFQKKSRSGISTPRQDRELIEKRWREVLSRRRLRRKNDDDAG
jgi:phage-related protein